VLSSKKSCGSLWADAYIRGIIVAQENHSSRFDHCNGGRAASNGGAVDCNLYHTVHAFSVLVRVVS
jgi:hypothetical protein